MNKLDFTCCQMGVQRFNLCPMCNNKFNIRLGPRSQQSARNICSSNIMLNETVSDLHIQEISSNYLTCFSDLKVKMSDQKVRYTTKPSLAIAL